MANDRNFVSVIVNDADTSATGTVLAKTVVGSMRVRGVFFAHLTGTAPVVELQLVRGAVVTTIRSDNADYLLSEPGILLLDGDVIRLETVTLGATSTVDAAIFGD